MDDCHGVNQVPRSSTSNRQDLGDITNIGVTNTENCTTLQTSAHSSRIDSIQTNQVRRPRGRPRLSAQPVTVNRQVLGDISNIGVTNAHNCNAFQLSAPSSRIDSIQTPQVRRPRGRPRLSAQPVTVNRQVLGDITNIGVTNAQNCNALQPSAPSSRIDSIQTPQVRRPRGRPRLTAQPVTVNRQVLRDITNIVVTNAQNGNTLQPSAPFSHIDSIPTPQVRRPRGRPRLSAQPVSVNSDIHVRPLRRRVRPFSPSASRCVRQALEHTGGDVQYLPYRSNMLDEENPSSDFTDNDENVRLSMRQQPRSSVSCRSTADIHGTQNYQNPVYSNIRHVEVLSSGSHLTNAHVRVSTRLSQQNFISSRTVIGVDGIPVHHSRPSETRVMNLQQFSVTSEIRTQVLHCPVSSNNEENNNMLHSGVYRNARQHRRMFAYCDCGDATRQCTHCAAILWYEERTIKTYSPRNPKFSICCGEGKVKLPLLTEGPLMLRELMDYNGGERSKVFRKNIKLLCSMFSFTSTGGRINRDINDGRGPYTFRLNGHNHHRMGTLLPTHEDGRPRFAQLYIYDTEHEIDNRFHALNRSLCSEGEDVILRILVQDLITMLNEHNPLVKAFRMAKERFRNSSMQPVTLRLIGTRERDGRQYNLPTTSEVAALIPGDGNPTDSRDVIVEERGREHGRNCIKRISELHPSFMALQYPLLFPYGEDGFRLHIPLNVDETTTRKYLSLREYYCFRLHHRLNEGKTLHKAGRLFHTYVVDAYTAVLEHELDWYKRNQDTIRSELYNGLHDRISNGETNLDSIG